MKRYYSHSIIVPKDAEKISIYGKHDIANQRAVLANYPVGSLNAVYSDEPFILIIKIKGVIKLIGSKKGEHGLDSRRRFITEGGSILLSSY